MLVFIDESGDAGFKVAEGSSPVFVVAMVIFADREAAQVTEAKLAELRMRLRVKPEFKFSKCSDEVRDQFFAGVAHEPFYVRSIVVKKELIWSSALKEDTDRFYNYFVKQMMKYDNGLLARAKVRIDGSGERVFRQELSARLRRELGPRIKEVKFSDSREDLLVQLADMCAGAIARSRRNDRKNSRRWLQVLQPRIADIWDFK